MGEGGFVGEGGGVGGGRGDRRGLHFTTTG